MKKISRILSMGLASVVAVSSIIVYAEDFSSNEVQNGVIPFDNETMSISESEIPMLDTNITSSVQWQVLKETNKQRLQTGQAPLSLTIDLLDAANIRAQECTTLYSHTRPNGSLCYTILDDLGMHYSSAGENIAAGQTSANHVVDSWMNSQGHKANILNGDYSHLGPGYSYSNNSIYWTGNYWTQLFVGRCSPTPVSYYFAVGAGYNAFHTGTSIEDMSIIIVAYCEDHGYSYVPVQEGMYDNSFNINQIGTQMLSIGYNGHVADAPIVLHPYDDVGNDWYTQGVLTASLYYQFMTGLNSNTFGVGNNLARAQLALILYRIEGQPTVQYSDVFPDVGKDLWYTNAILWANNAGVVTGYTSNGYFGPNDSINREQMAVMMYRYAKMNGLDTSKTADFSKFKDANNVNDFAIEAMRWAVGTGIITGKDNGTRLDPQGNTSRAEAAIILTRFAEMYME